MELQLAGLPHRAKVRAREFSRLATRVGQDEGVPLRPALDHPPDLRLDLQWSSLQAV